MRHRVRSLMKRRKLNRPHSHRLALFRNLAREVFEHGSIMTTTAKAKAVKPFIERILTKAKEAHFTENKERSIALRRQIYKHFNDRKLVKKICDEIAPKFENRNGGYLRIVKIGPRRGDAAEMSLLQLVVTQEESEE